MSYIIIACTFLALGVELGAFFVRHMEKQAKGERAAFLGPLKASSVSSSGGEEVTIIPAKPASIVPAVSKEEQMDAEFFSDGQEFV